MNENSEPVAKLRLLKARTSTIGSFAVSTRQKKPTPATTATTASTTDGPSWNQSFARALFEHVFEAAEEGRERREAEIVEMVAAA